MKKLKIGTIFKCYHAQYINIKIGIITSIDGNQYEYDIIKGTQSGKLFKFIINSNFYRSMEILTSPAINILYGDNK